MSINSKAALQQRIIELEQKKVEKEQMLKERFNATKESLKPANLIKEGFSNFTAANGMGAGILKTAAGIGIGLLSKKLLPGGSSSKVTKALGKVIEIAAANTTIENADKIKAYGVSIYKNLFRKKKKKNAEIR